MGSIIGTVITFCSISFYFSFGSTFTVLWAKKGNNNVACLTRICTMVKNLSSTAFYRPNINMRHEDYQSSLRIPGHEVHKGGPRRLY